MTPKRSIVFPGAARDLVLQSSPAWADVLVIEQHRALPDDRADLCPAAHVLMLNLGPCRIGLRASARTGWVEAAPNSLSIVGAGSRLEWTPRPGSQMLAAALAPMFMAAVAGQSGKAAGLLRSQAGLADAGIIHVLLALRAELERKCPAGRVYWEALATALAAQLLRSYVVGPPKAAPCSGGLAPARLRRVLDHIEAHLHQELCLRELAGIAVLSPSHFATAFRKSTGMPPYRYAMHRRAHRAKDMLADPLQPLADIAYALGYSSQAHFTTMFRKLTGLAPGAYRSSVATDAAPVFARSLNDRRQAKDLVAANP